MKSDILRKNWFCSVHCCTFSPSLTHGTTRELIGVHGLQVITISTTPRRGAERQVVLCAAVRTMHEVSNRFVRVFSSWRGEDGLLTLADDSGTGWRCAGERWSGNWSSGDNWGHHKRSVWNEREWFDKSLLKKSIFLPFALEKCMKNTDIKECTKSFIASFQERSSAGIQFTQLRAFLYNILKEKKTRAI